MSTVKLHACDLEKEYQSGNSVVLAAIKDNNVSYYVGVVDGVSFAGPFGSFKEAARAVDKTRQDFQYIKQRVF